LLKEELLHTIVYYLNQKFSKLGESILVSDIILWFYFDLKIKIILRLLLKVTAGD